MSRCSKMPYSVANNHFSTYSFICKVVCKLPDKYKKRALALLFVAMEAISVVLDLFGGSKVIVLLAAFLLSALGFAVTLYTACIMGSTKLKAERQLQVVEFVFSLLQLVATFLHLALTVLHVKNNYNLSTFFPLAFTFTAMIFAFKDDGEHSESKPGYLSLKYPLPNGPVPGSTPTKLDQNILSVIEENEELRLVNFEPSTSLHGSSPIVLDQILFDKVEPENPSRRRSNVSSDMDRRPHLVQVFKSGSSTRLLDISRFNSYSDLCSELGHLFGLKGQLEDLLRSGWMLSFVDQENDILHLGDAPWPEFVDNVWYIKILSPPEVQRLGKARAARL